MSGPRPRCGDRIYVTTSGRLHKTVLVKEYDEGGWRTVAWMSMPTKRAVRRWRRRMDRITGRIG